MFESGVERKTIEHKRASYDRKRGKKEDNRT